MMLLPTNISANDVSLYEFSDGGILPGLILNIFAFISLSIIEPFYVASGFSLYLNRRTHLEAWDIELKFRSLAKRVGSNKTSNKTIAVLLVSLFIANSDINLINPVYAKTTDSNYTEISNKQAKSVINKILASDEFSKKIKTENWRVKEGLFKDLFKDDKDNKKSEMLGFSIFGILISTILSYILYFLLGLVILAVLLFLIFKFFNFLPRGIFQFSNQKKLEAKVETLFGMDLNPDTLPDDVGAHAWVLWQSENFLESLSLLYRGSLSKLVNRDGVKLPFSATEGDCLRILKSSHIQDNLELINYFETLTTIWQRAAYAHRLPEISNVKQICDSWSPLFHVESTT